ncbi:MAG: TetR family transcriptional regulator [Pseudomonadota bacterium]
MSTTDISRAPVKKRKTQERTEATKGKLLEAALKEFADRGFDAVTVRDIEVAAGVQRGLLSYHFGDKQTLWTAAVENIVHEYREYRRVRSEVVKDLSEHEQLAFRIRAFVRFSAKRPELNRLMMQEGKRDNPRLRYIIDNFLRESRPELRKLVQSDLSLTDEEFIHWYYMYLGGSALVFSLAPEAKQLFDIDVTDEDFITRHAQFVANFLTGGFPASKQAANDQ